MSFGQPDPVTAGDTETLDCLITLAHAKKASDLFLKAESAPALWRLGQIESSGLPILQELDVRKLVYARLDSEQRDQFERDHELNLSYTVPNVTRIRQNVYMQRGGIATTCRLIPLVVPTLDQLNV